MITRYSASIGGVALQSIDPSIYIIDIEESTPSVNVVTMQRAGGDGMHVARRQRQSLTVAIRFMVREYDIAKRKEIFGKIAKWARGNYLMINDRPGQRLRVQCDAPPVVSSSLKWTEVQTLLFTAYQKPYWEGTSIATVSKTTKNGTVDINVPGTAENCTFEVRVVNADTVALTKLTVKTMLTRLSVEGLNVPAGSTVRFYYNDDGILILPKCTRTADSSDDLLLRCGTTETVTITADAMATVTINARGRFE